MRIPSAFARRFLCRRIRRAENLWTAFTNMELVHVAARLHAMVDKGDVEAAGLLREAIAEIDRRRP